MYIYVYIKYIYIYIYIYILLLLSPNRPHFPWSYVFQGFWPHFLKNCFWLLNGDVRQNRLLLQKFIWRYYNNAFGARGFSLKNVKNAFGTSILMVSERPRVTTTTADDGKTALPLTFFSL